MSSTITIEISPAELIDKITILEIKLERIEDKEKIGNIRIEYDSLIEAKERTIRSSPDLEKLIADLKSVNEVLWEIEDDIRACERIKDFGPAFIELARSVYIRNDDRSRIKRQINELLGSRLIEEKSYAAY